MTGHRSLGRRRRGSDLLVLALARQHHSATINLHERAGLRAGLRAHTAREAKVDVVMSNASASAAPTARCCSSASDRTVPCTPPGRHHGGLGVSGPRARCAPFRVPVMFQTLRCRHDRPRPARLSPQRNPLLMSPPPRAPRRAAGILLLMGNGILALHADGVVVWDGVAHAAAS